MWFRCIVLLVCLSVICAQKGGRQASASDANPSVVRSPSRALSQRKLPQASELVQQIEEPDEDRDPDEDRQVVSGVRPTRPRPQVPRPRPASQPQPTEEEGHEPAPEPYSFSYQVDDPETGAASSREETQDANGEIIGYYHIKDAEGRTRRVDYTAGKEGFKATIKSNEEGLNARAPADVNIELSASPSETRASYAPNNRPTGAESSLKGTARAPSERFFQRLVPQPDPVAAPSAPQPLEQTAEQSVPEEAQISQQYEPSEASDPQQIVQQRDAEEVPFESAPVKGGPTVVTAPVGPNFVDVPRLRPAERQIASFQPQRLQNFREQGVINLQPVIAPQPFEQVREELPNSIQDVQESVKPVAPEVYTPPASTKTVAVTPQRQYTALRPLSPILGGAQVDLPPVRPVGTVTPVFSSYFHQSAPVQQLQQVQPVEQVQPVQQVQQLQPLQVQQVEPQPQVLQLNPPSNNYIVQQTDYRQPISQEQLINTLHPIQIDQGPQQVAVQRPTPVQTPTFTSYNERTYQNLGPSGVTYVPEAPRPVSPPAQEVITQERIQAEEPEPVQPVAQVQQPVQNIQTGWRVQEIQPVEQAPRPAPIPLPILRQPTFHYQPILPVWAQQNAVQLQQGGVLTQPQSVQLAQQQPIQVAQPQQIQFAQPQQYQISQPQQIQISQPQEIQVAQPLPAPQQVEQRQDSVQFDEPQVYEPASQTSYEPLEPSEESRAAPPRCECAKQAESRADPVKGSASEPAPVKGERLSSPARNVYIPQAFRTR